MATDQLLLAPYFIQYAKDYLGGAGADSIYLVNPSISVTEGPVFTWGNPTVSETLQDQLTVTETNVNNGSSAVVWPFSKDVSWQTLYEWNITMDMADAIAAKTFTATPYLNAGPIVGDFPPAQVLSVAAPSLTKLTKTFSDDPISEGILVPAKSSYSAYVVATYKQYSIPIVAAYHYGGMAQYAFVYGPHTHTTIAFYGVGTMLRPYNLPYVTVEDDNNLRGECGGTFSGNLLESFNIISGPSGSTLPREIRVAAGLPRVSSKRTHK